MCCHITYGFHGSENIIKDSVISEKTLMHYGHADTSMRTKQGAAEKQHESPLIFPTRLSTRAAYIIQLIMFSGREHILTHARPDKHITGFRHTSSRPTQQVLLLSYICLLMWPLNVKYVQSPTTTNNRALLV